MKVDRDLEPQGGRSAITLSWIPLGVVGHVVRISGGLYETGIALIQRRRPCALYHSALEVVVPEGRFVVEMTVVPDHHGKQRGVVAGGPVGAGPAGLLRIFRYEIRRWQDGVIDDAGRAIKTPLHTGDEMDRARRLLDLVPSVPTPVWGRDHLRTGEMWNSNSVTSWLLARAGIDTGQIHTPPGGRAPGWNSGLIVAARASEDRAH